MHAPRRRPRTPGGRRACAATVGLQRPCRRPVRRRQEQTDALGGLLRVGRQAAPAVVDRPRPGNAAHVEFDRHGDRAVREHQRAVERVAAIPAQGRHPGGPVLGFPRRGTPDLAPNESGRREGLRCRGGHRVTSGPCRVANGNSRRARPARRASRRLPITVSSGWAPADRSRDVARGGAGPRRGRGCPQGVRFGGTAGFGSAERPVPVDRRGLARGRHPRCGSRAGVSARRRRRG